MNNSYIFNLLTLLLFFVLIEVFVAIINQYYVPDEKPYNELTTTQKILKQLRFYFNIIETIMISVFLFYYGKFLNWLTILFLVSMLISAFRYFLFALQLVYYFVNKTEKNMIIVDFIEKTFGKIQNWTNFILIVIIIARIYFFKFY